MVPCMMLFFGFVFAACLLLTVVPPLFIDNPARHPNESHGPPDAGQLIPEKSLSHSVKQKLYILFVLPACGVANAFILYMFYYRHVRGAAYRVEMSILANAKLAGQAAAVLKKYAETQGIANVSFIGDDNASVHHNAHVALGVDGENTFYPMPTGPAGSPAGYLNAAADATGKFGTPMAANLEHEILQKAQVRPRHLNMDVMPSTLLPELSGGLLAGVQKQLAKAAKTRREVLDYLALLMKEEPFRSEDGFDVDM